MRRLGHAGGGKQHLLSTGVRRVGRAGITCGAEGEGRAEWTRDYYAPTPAIWMNFPVDKELHTHFLVLPLTRPRRQWEKGLMCPLQLLILYSRTKAVQPTGTTVQCANLARC